MPNPLTKPQSELSSEINSQLQRIFNSDSNKQQERDFNREELFEREYLANPEEHEYIYPEFDPIAESRRSRNFVDRSELAPSIKSTPPSYKKNFFIEALIGLDVSNDNSGGYPVRTNHLIMPDDDPLILTAEEFHKQLMAIAINRVVLSLLRYYSNPFRVFMLEILLADAIPQDNAPSDPSFYGEFGKDEIDYSIYKLPKHFQAEFGKFGNSGINSKLCPKTNRVCNRSCAS